jgi:two-component system response regulator FlrC
MESFARRHGKQVNKFSSDAILKMKNYSWPGNVRELQNVLERAVILSEQRKILEADDLKLPEEGKGEELKITSLAQMERNMIQRALEQCNGNRTHAAKLLGVSLRTLRNRLSEYRKEGLPFAI